MTSADERSAQLAILEAAAKANPRSADFGRLMVRLELPAIYRGQVVRVLCAGHWRRAHRPFECVQRGTLRAAIGESDLDNSHGQVIRGFTFDEMLHSPNYDAPSTVRPLAERVRPNFRRVGKSGHVSINWPALMEAADFDEWERKALLFRRIGIGLRTAMSFQTSIERRQLLAAAWKRVDRALPRLKKILAE